MTNSSIDFSAFSQTDMPSGLTPDDIAANRYTEAALIRHKREGLELAVRARWIALAVVAVLLPFLVPGWQVLWPEFLLCLVALNGWFLRRYGRVGVSRAELFLIGVDVVLMTIALLMPNPFAPEEWPATIVFEFQTFLYFYVILAVGALSYSWRTIMALGNWISASWLIGVALIWYFSEGMPEVSAQLLAMFPDQPLLAEILDAGRVHWDRRIQEVIVFLLTAYTLAAVVRRFNRLLLGNAVLERERTNLSRYFSPSMVEELSNSDDPLREIRSHDVAVLFVDIVGFTAYASTRDATAVIGTLRAFHGRMEECVFANEGTLDKYLGDGLMATFGTPVLGPQDARNAVTCVMHMMDAVDALNAERAAGGHAKIDARFGLHFGPVVLGDIGSNRLEFAVIGNTVNVASRLEGLSRQLGCRGVISDAAVRASGGHHRFDRADPQKVRGVSEPIAVWTVS